MKKTKSSRTALLSIVTPAFNESQNLPVLYERLKKALGRLKLSWEWIVVDDHSRDDTYEVMAKIAAKDKRVHVLRFAENRGSHLALACSLREAKGTCAIGMAADLQDPPETIGALYKKWKDGAKVVWAVREAREGESASTILFAHLYYFIVRHVVGLKQVPPSGADFFLLDREILTKLSQAKLRNASILLLICSFGGRQDQILYTKKARLHGKSGWNLRKKLKLFFDSVTMFTLVPLYWLFAVGALFVASGLWGLTRPVPGFWVDILCYTCVVLGNGLVFVALFLACTVRIALASADGPLWSIEKRSK